MENICPSSFFSNSNWLSKSSVWTKEENKSFEKALALFGEGTPNRWFRVAAMIPGKTPFDVMRQYQELEEDVSDIEAGLVPIPGYFTSTFTLESFDKLYGGSGKRSSTGRLVDPERKKGVPWTEDEHRRFLLGLQKHGKGDWRNISKNFVISKTPTQVASHAQKYYIRQHSGGKDKRRPSIHDITTVNLTASDDLNTPLVDQSVLSPQKKAMNIPKILLDWNHSIEGKLKEFDSIHSNPLMPSLYGARIGGYNSMFQVHQIHG